MAGKMFDAMYGRDYTDREGKDRTHWINVGRAWRNVDDQGRERTDITLYVMPPPSLKTGEIRISLMEPRMKEGETRGQAQQRQGGRSYGNQGGHAAPSRGGNAPDPDDNLPF